MSNFTLRLDAKGRVSIPAPFRGILAREGFDGLYCYPALDAPAFDAGGNSLLKEIETLTAQFPLYSDERDHLLLALFGTSETLKFDAEGRVLLPEALLAHTGIAQSVSFVGLGHKFQIWEPERFRTQLAEAIEKVRALKRQLGSRMAGAQSRGARE